MHTFEDIRGHEGVVRGLRQAVLAGRAPHAVIFAGQPGIGKRLIAKSLAKALQCEGRGEDSASACCACVSCRTFESGNHPDIFYVRATKTKAIGVDDVREQIVAPMAVRPYKYPYKIFIVDQGDTMSIGAQNALLKTIEEPSSFGVFMLLCENPSAFLPTVLSRCVLFNLKPLPDHSVIRYLTDNGVSGADAARVAPYAGGSIGQAMVLVGDEAFADMRRRMLDIAARVGGEPVEALFPLAAEFEDYKERIQEALNILLMWYRDVAVHIASGRPGLIAGEEALARACSGADGISLCQAVENCAAVWQAKRQLARYGNFQLTIEIMLLKLKGEIK